MTHRAPPEPAPVQFAFGEVRHARLRPVINRFRYRAFFLRLRIDRPMAPTAVRLAGIPLLGLGRPGLISFRPEDHGDGTADPAGWARSILAGAGLEADGAIWLHCFARVLGYAFRPVSFWFCHATDGRLVAVLAEVNNTFGERHCYLLDAPRYGQPCEADKVFHVSPFCPVRGRYRFVFMRTDGPSPRTVARIDYFDDAQSEQALLNTSVSGELLPLNARTLRRALWTYPAMTLGVIARIHWQALRLWLKQAPFFRQPPAPAEFVSAPVTPSPTSSP